MNDSHRPAEPAGDDKERGGYTEVAKRLNKKYPERKRPISRQLVHKWYMYRHHNGFPAPESMSGSGTGRPEFNLAGAEEWYVNYRRSHGDPQIQQRSTSTPIDPRSIRNDGGDSLAA